MDAMLRETVKFSQGLNSVEVHLTSIYFVIHENSLSFYKVLCFSLVFGSKFHWGRF